MSETGSVTRVLVSGAGENNLILTEVIDAAKGTSTTWLKDDSSQWWARLEIVYPAESASLGEFFRLAQSAESVDVQLSWQGKSTSQLEQPVEPTLELMAHGFVQDLAARGELDAVRRAIPKDLVPALLFLQSQLSAESSLEADDSNASSAYAVRGALEVLAQSVAYGLEETSDLDTAESQWVLTIGETHKGHHVASSDLLELAGRFQSVQNVDPLSDLDLGAVGRQQHARD